MNVFFDTDVILDVATAREPFCDFAAKSLSLAETGKIKGFTSATIFINVFYVLRKLIGRDKALLFLRDLELVLTVLPTDGKMVHNALYSAFSGILCFFHYICMTVKNNGKGRNFSKLLELAQYSSKT